VGVNDIALVLTLIIAVFTDWREQKIYNKLLIPAFLAALILQTFQGGISGLTSSLLGAGLGFTLLLLPYFMGGIGAGDVKLLAVIGAFGGATFALTSFLYGAIIGGIISAILLARSRALISTIMHLLLLLPFLRRPKHLSEAMNNTSQEKFPYGIAISLGTLISLYFPVGGGWS